MLANEFFFLFRYVDGWLGCTLYSYRYPRGVRPGRFWAGGAVSCDTSASQVPPVPVSCCTSWGMRCEERGALKRAPEVLEGVLNGGALVWRKVFSFRKSCEIVRWWARILERNSIRNSSPKQGTKVPVAHCTCTETAVTGITDLLLEMDCVATTPVTRRCGRLKAVSFSGPWFMWNHFPV